MMDVCGHTSDDKAEMCVGAIGHRGRHKMRPTGIEGVPPVEMKESVVEPDGSKIAIIDRTEPPIVKEPTAWVPGADDFVSLKGKAYLPARRRIQWMRGLPEPHPDWTIDTEITEHVLGKLVKPGPVGVGKIDGGYAVVRANVYDSDGRLIATGLKSEYSENFADYLEKAETGAIARALAVAGYGTESALDLDEGVDAGRIADAPVESSRGPVRLGASSVPGVGRGGKTEGSSVIQIRRVAELSRELDISPEALVSIMDSLFGKAPHLGTDESANSAAIATFLAERGGAEVGRLISTLETALAGAPVMEVAK